MPSSGDPKTVSCLDSCTVRPFLHWWSELHRFTKLTRPVVQSQILLRTTELRGQPGGLSNSGQEGTIQGRASSRSFDPKSQILPTLLARSEANDVRAVPSLAHYLGWLERNRIIKLDR